MQPPTFLSCDWGSTHFRLRLVRTSTLHVEREVVTRDGAAVLARDGVSERAAVFEERFLRAVKELDGAGDLGACGCCAISGMASGSMGWRELPYMRAPVHLAPESMITDSFECKMPGREPLRITLISGIRTSDDVMRGEETELLGLLNLMPELADREACIILPGTHSKHARLRDGVLHDFTTFMTGELFASLPLLATLAPAFTQGEEYRAEAFAAGVNEARRGSFPASLFKLRARAVLTGAKYDSASFLSGLLIGTELLHAGLYSLPIFICGEASLSAHYSSAAHLLGIGCIQVPSNVQALVTLRAHRSILFKT